MFFCAWDSSNSNGESSKPSSKWAQTSTYKTQRYLEYVKAAAQITLEKAQDRAQSELKYQCSDEEHQQRHTYVYVCFFLHGIAQIPVEQAQDKAQNGFKRTRTGHQGICSM